MYECYCIDLGLSGVRNQAIWNIKLFLNAEIL